MKIGFIGNLGDEKTVGGQITKTREMIAYFLDCNGCLDIAKKIRGGCCPNDVYNQEWIDILDVGKSRNVPEVFINLFGMFKSCDNIIVVLASPGYFRLLPLLWFLNKIYRRHIYEVVIGGIRYEYLDYKRCFMEKAIEQIYVETSYMVQKYSERGLDNVEYMPNFKKMCMREIVQSPHSDLKVCTFSRIDENKGIDTAVQIMNLLTDRNDITMDIIGPVNKKYEARFDVLLSQSNNNVKYKGSICRDEINECLSQYDVLLFPTKWKAEGFPGVFLDSFENGLVILATDMPAFRDVITNDYNGKLFKQDDVEAYAEYIRKLADDRELLNVMKLHSIDCRKKYETEEVLKTLANRIFMTS